MNTTTTQVIEKQTKRFYWLKLKDNFFEREEIQLIESLPNGKEYVLILLKFMMKAINTEGRLVVKDLIPYNPQMLATVTHSNIDTVHGAIDIFIKFGLMSTLDDGTLYMNEVRTLLGSETEFAAKKREYRQSQKNNPQLPDKSKTKKDIVSDNVRQENRDKRLKNIPLNPPCADSSNNNLGGAEIWGNAIAAENYNFSEIERNSIKDFAVYKAGFGVITEQQIKYTLDILAENKNAGYDICRMIKHYIAKGYKGVMLRSKFMAKQSLIKAVKQVKKVSINIPLSKDMVDQFNAELELYNKKFGVFNKLNFDALGKKLVKELQSFNASNAIDKNNNIK